MHRTAFPWPQRRTRTRGCRAGPLKNRLPRNGSSGRRTACSRAVRNRLPGLHWRCLVNRTRSGLRNDHAWSRCLGPSRRWGRCGCGRTLRLNRRRGWRTRSGRSGSMDLRRRCHGTGRRWPGRYGRRDRGWCLWRNNRRYGRRNRPGRGNRRWSNNSGCNRSWRWGRRGSWFRSYRNSGGRLGLMRRRGNRFRRRSRCRRRSGLLFVQDGFQHVSGLGDMRQVNLGLDFVRAAIGSTTGFSRAMPVS